MAMRFPFSRVLVNQKAKKKSKAKSRSRMLVVEGESGDEEEEDSDDAFKGVILGSINGSAAGESDSRVGFKLRGSIWEDNKQICDRRGPNPSMDLGLGCSSAGAGGVGGSSSQSPQAPNLPSDRRFVSTQACRNHPDPGRAVLNHEGGPRFCGSKGGGICSLYVGNLPHRVTSQWLFEKFKEFGVVKDVFLHGKYSSVNGMRFAFVRFASLAEAGAAVEKMNGVCVEGLLLEVNLAKHSRCPVLKSSIEGRRRTYARAVALRRGGAELKCLPGPPVLPSSDGGLARRTFAQVVQGSCCAPEEVIEKSCKNALSSAVASHRNRRRVGGVGSSKDWLYCSTIAIIRNDLGIVEARNSVQSQVCSIKSISFLGGRSILISFSPTNSCDNALRNVDWSVWVKSIKPWSSELSFADSSCWIECRGIPFIAWNWETFNAIANLWGSLIEAEAETLAKVQLVSARLKIASNHLAINEAIDLDINGSLFAVHVASVHGNVVSASLSNAGLVQGSVLGEEGFSGKVGAVIAAEVQEEVLNEVCRAAGAVCSDHEHLLSNVSSPPHLVSCTEAVGEVIAKEGAHLQQGEPIASGPKLSVPPNGELGGIVSSEDFLISVDAKNSGSMDAEGLGEASQGGAGGGVHPPTSKGPQKVGISEGPGSNGWQLISTDCATNVINSGETKLDRDSMNRVLGIISVTIEVGKATGISFSQQDERIIK